MLIFDKNSTADVLGMYKALQDKALEGREKTEQPSHILSEFSKDLTRVLYSSSFRRLGDKMQLLSVDSDTFYRKRLTHSLEVSNIALMITKALNVKTRGAIEYKSDEIALMEAAAYAHDIGHPAFGHKGERVLDDLAQKYGLRFEGNAQNFRVLRKLDRCEASNHGLNLTFRTLLAINKYCKSDKVEAGCIKPEKFMYDSDYRVLLKLRDMCKLGHGKTLDAQIIELADDIAYLVHDLEDGLAVSVVTLNELVYGIRNYESDKFTDEEKTGAADLFSEMINGVERKLKYSVVNTQQEYMHLFRVFLSSLMKSILVRNIEFDIEKKELTLKKTHKALCKILSKITMRNVMRNTDIALYEARGEVVIRTLFNIYSNKNINRNFALMPPDYRPKTDNIEEIVRTAIDYISGMSDSFARNKFRELTGVDFENISIAELRD